MAPPISSQLPGAPFRRASVLNHWYSKVGLVSPFGSEIPPVEAVTSPPTNVVVPEIVGLPVALRGQATHFAADGDVTVRR